MPVVDLRMLNALVSWWARSLLPFHSAAVTHGRKHLISSHGAHTRTALQGQVGMHVCTCLPAFVALVRSDAVSGVSLPHSLIRVHACMICVGLYGQQSHVWQLDTTDNSRMSGSRTLLTAAACLAVGHY